MSTFGQTTIATVGRGPVVSADGQFEAKQGGVTLDWSVVAAVSGSDVSLNDNVTIKIGERYLRYGQVICKITGGEISTLTLAGGAGADTFTITVVNSAAATDTTAAIAFDADAAAITAAIELLDTVGAGNVVATGSVNGPFTLTFATSLGDLTVSGTGTGMTATVTTTSEGARTNLYGPYNSAATDGRQTITPGSCFILNSTVKENDRASDHAGVAIYGGLVYRDRILAHVDTASLANGPVWANLIAALPRLQPVLD